MKIRGWSMYNPVKEGSTSYFVLIIKLNTYTTHTPFSFFKV